MDKSSTAQYYSDHARVSKSRLLPFSYIVKDWEQRLPLAYKVCERNPKNVVQCAQNV
jgi:hypothetical protein